MSQTPPAVPISAGTLVLRPLYLAALWLLLTEGNLSSLWIGVPTIVVAQLLSLRVLPSTGVRPVAVLRFTPMFLWRSLVGAWDVALRALRPSRPLAPALARYEMRLRHDFSRVVFANTVSLLPGTLSADIDGRWLSVHFIDDTPQAHAELATLEAAVAELFVHEGAA